MTSQIFMVAGAVMLAFGEMGGPPPPRRLTDKTPIRAPLIGVLSDDNPASIAYEINKAKRERQQKVVETKRRQRREKRQRVMSENNDRQLSIKSFCGRQFGEKWNGRATATVDADKLYFGAYSRLRLKYSRVFGLYSITAINDDAFAIGDVNREFARIRKIVERNFGFEFSGEVEKTDNGTHDESVLEAPPEEPSAGAEGEGEAGEPGGENMAEAIRGLRGKLNSVRPTPATRWESRISERLEDFTISIVGIQDEKKDKLSVEVTVEMIPPRQRKPPKKE